MKLLNYAAEREDGGAYSTQNLNDQAPTYSGDREQKIAILIAEDNTVNQMVMTRF